MKTSKQTRREAKQLFVNCLVDGKLDEDRVRHTVRSVIERRPRRYISVLGQFQRLVKLDISRRTARVESAEPLTPKFRDSVRQNLENLYPTSLIIEFHENAGLIGGMRIQVGSDVYDGTIRHRLTHLEQQF